MLIVSAINLNVVALGYLQVSPSSGKTPCRSESVLTSDKMHEDMLLTDVNAKTVATENDDSCTHINNCEWKYVHRTAKAERKLHPFQDFLRDLLDFSLLQNKLFFVCCFCTSLMNFGMLCFNFHTPNRALHYGIADDMIAIFPSVIGICMFVARLLSGLIADASFIDRPLLYGVSIALGGVVEITYIFFTDFLGILIWCCLFGICTGKRPAVSLYTIIFYLFSPQSKIVDTGHVRLSVCRCLCHAVGCTKSVDSTFPGNRSEWYFSDFQWAETRFFGNCIVKKKKELASQLGVSLL